MQHRTYGKTRDCKGCRWWSEMLDKIDAGQVKAMCINSKSCKSMDYTGGSETCDEWENGKFGAVDDPSIDPDEPITTDMAIFYRGG